MITYDSLNVDGKKNPFMAVGGHELIEPVGKTEVCPKCRKPHPVEQSKKLRPVSRSEPQPKHASLQFVRCDGRTYLVGINGMRLPLPGMINDGV